jgi:hypothetical protein
LRDAIHSAAKLVGIEGEPEVLETKPRFSFREFLQSRWFGGGLAAFPTGVRLEYRMAF